MTNFSFTRGSRKTLTSFNGIEIFIDMVNEARPEQYYIYCRSFNNTYYKCGRITYRSGNLVAEFIPRVIVRPEDNYKVVYKTQLTVTDDIIVTNHMILGIQFIVSTFQIDDENYK